MPSSENSDIIKNGELSRPPSQFREAISASSDAKFPAEPDRYIIYLNLGCPWAHRVHIVYHLKGLTDLIGLSITSPILVPGEGWLYDGQPGTDAQDPLYGFKNLRQLYEKAKPDYKGRYTVPLIWDKKQETIVSNESSEIIRMLYTAFDAYLPSDLQEQNKPGGGLLPTKLKDSIDELNTWVYDNFNNGVYKVGFAPSQKVYEKAVLEVFEALDRLEAHLERQGTKYLFGEYVTDADIRAYTTLVRFDPAYVYIFKCNLGQIRYDYPRLHKYLRQLYWEENDETRGAFKRTTHFDVFKLGYTHAVMREAIVPLGPKPDIMPL